MNMKRKILIAAGAALLMVLAAACNKERQCKCITTDIPDDGLLKVMVVDNGLKCESITEMAFEQHVVTDEGHHSLTRTEVHQVSCRDYAE